MIIGLYTLTSPLHDEAAVNVSSAAFIGEIEKALGISFDFRGQNFSDYGSHDLELIYVRTGGTEGLFKEVLPELNGPIRILTSGKSNSLAASMEILSYLNMLGRTGEIIHGSITYISERIRTHAKVAERLGVTLINIPISEIEAEYSFSANDELGETAQAVDDEFRQNAPSALHKYADGAFRIYKALKSIIARYDLSGLTVRCFDLLESLGNTGCMALAILNSEGIPAGCEGDVPALVTMAVGNALTGVCGFQANPSRIDPETGEILFAHCTIPLNMLSGYGFNTHFESGIGIAICGQIPSGDATIFKISGDLSRTFCCDAQLIRCQSERDLCRTQAILKLEDKDLCRTYFLRNPVGNHHIIFPGRCKDPFEAFIAAAL